MKIDAVYMWPRTYIGQILCQQKVNSLYLYMTQSEPELINLNNFY